MGLGVLLASAGAAMVAVAIGTSGQPPAQAGSAERQAPSGHGFASSVTDQAAAFGRILADVGGAATSNLSGTARAIAADASPDARRALEVTRGVLADPRHGPLVVGGLGVAAGIAFGMLLGRRRRSAAPHVTPMPSAEKAQPLPTSAADAMPAPAAVVIPTPPPALLLAGNAPNDAFIASDPPQSPAEAPPPAELSRDDLIAAIVTIFEEEARLAADSRDEEPVDTKADAA